MLTDFFLQLSKLVKNYARFRQKLKSFHGEHCEPITFRPSFIVQNRFWKTIFE